LSSPEDNATPPGTLCRAAAHREARGPGALPGTVAGLLGGEPGSAEARAPAGWTPLWRVPIGTAILTTILWTFFFRYSSQQDLARFETASTGAA
jgi:hypothetical protein